MKRRLFAVKRRLFATALVESRRMDSFVYFVRDSASGEIKVGCTLNPKARFRPTREVRRIVAAAKRGELAVMDACGLPRRSRHHYRRVA